jgi:hypothetical protein
VSRPPGHYGGGYYAGPYYRYYPYYHGYYGGYYGPWFGFGWWGGYPWYGYPGPYYYGGPNDSAVRLEVKPREAEVYVDGSLAGIVDDFDGTFQRLHLPPGEHEIEIYLEGYKSVRQKFLLTPGSTFRIKHVMQPLAPGEAQEPRPTPPPPAADQPQPSPQAAGQGPFPRPGPRWREPVAPPAVSSNFGTLSIRVQPPGADVFIDGERWQGPDGQQRLVVEVAEGVHKVEIRKDRYQNFTAEVTVRSGEVTPLNVSLLVRED